MGKKRKRKAENPQIVEFQEEVKTGTKSDTAIPGKKPSDLFPMFLINVRFVFPLSLDYNPADWTMVASVCDPLIHLQTVSQRILSHSLK